MDGVDHSDQYRERGSGFTSKAQKRCKKAYFAIIDFIILNTFFAWNMSVPEVEYHSPLKRNEANTAFVEGLISFVDFVGLESPSTLTSNPYVLDIEGHSPMPVYERKKCSVHYVNLSKDG